MFSVFTPQIFHFDMVEKMMLVMTVNREKTGIFAYAHPILEVGVLITNMLINWRTVDVLLKTVIDEVAHILLMETVDNSLVETRLTGQHEL